MGGGFLVDDISLLEDGILNDLVEKRLGNRGEGRGIGSWQTLFVSAHVSHIPDRTESDGVGSKSQAPAIDGERIQERIGGDVIGLT